MKLIKSFCLGPGPPIWGTPSKSAATGSGLPSTRSPFEQRVSAKTHGTKYHNPPPETNWREAITEDGNVYYWHTISHGKLLYFSISKSPSPKSPCTEIVPDPLY